MHWIKHHKVLAIVSLLVLSLVLTITVLAVVTLQGYQSTVVETTTHHDPETSPTPPPTPDPLAPYSILLLGHGDPQHAGGSLTDSMILAYIQPRKQSIHLISLTRDIWVELPLLPDD